jgi:hypothetical protein
MRVRLSHVVTVLALGTSLALAASERGKPTATLGGKKVTIDYGRPALKGRALADLLKQLSEDRVWRAGDDQVTTLTSETDLEIGGKRVEAGKYSVYVHLPADGSRNLLLNTDLGQPLIKLWDKAPANMANEPWPYIGDYQAKIGSKETLRAAMKKETTSKPVDVFTAELTPVKDDGAKLKLSWGDESWSIDVKAAK